jgi:hypothetical protein
MDEQIVRNLIHLFCERNIIQPTGKNDGEVGKRFPAHDCRLKSGFVRTPFWFVAHAVILSAVSRAGIPRMATGRELRVMPHHTMIA